MLLVTLFQNQRELSLSRKEFEESKEALQAQAKTLDKQRFEDTFFSLLNQHNLSLERIPQKGKPNNTNKEVLDNFKEFKTLNEAKKATIIIITIHQSKFQSSISTFKNHSHSLLRKYGSPAIRSS